MSRTPDWMRKLTHSTTDFEQFEQYKQMEARGGPSIAGFDTKRSKLKKELSILNRRETNENIKILAAQTKLLELAPPKGNLDNIADLQRLLNDDPTSPSEHNQETSFLERVLGSGKTPLNNDEITIWTRISADIMQLTTDLTSLRHDQSLSKTQEYQKMCLHVIAHDKQKAPAILSEVEHHMEKTSEIIDNTAQNHLKAINNLRSNNSDINNIKEFIKTAIEFERQYNDLLAYLRSRPNGLDSIPPCIVDIHTASKLIREKLGHFTHKKLMPQAYEEFKTLFLNQCHISPHSYDYGLTTSYADGTQILTYKPINMRTITRKEFDQWKLKMENELCGKIAKHNHATFPHPHPFLKLSDAVDFIVTDTSFIILQKPGRQFTTQGKPTVVSYLREQLESEFPPVTAASQTALANKKASTSNDTDLAKAESYRANTNHEIAPLNTNSFRGRQQSHSPSIPSPLDHLNNNAANREIYPTVYKQR